MSNIITPPITSGGNIITPGGRGGSQITPQPAGRQGASTITPGGGESIQPGASRPAPPSAPGVSTHEQVVARTEAKIQERRQQQEDHIAELWAYYLGVERQKAEIEGRPWRELETEPSHFEEVFEKFKDRLKDAGIDVAKSLTLKGLEVFSKRVLSKMTNKVARMGAGFIDKVLPRLSGLWNKSVGLVGQLDTFALLGDLAVAGILEAGDLYSTASHPEWIKSVDDIPLIGNIVNLSFDLGNLIAVGLGLSKSDSQIKKERAIKYFDDFSGRIMAELNTRIQELERSADYDQKRIDAIDPILSEEYEAEHEALGLINRFNLPPGTSRDALRDFARDYVNEKAPDFWSQSYRQAVAKEIGYFAFIELNPKSPQAIAYRNKISRGDYIGV
jgi:hypothetical protein